MKTPDLSDSYSSAIAIVGMAGRFPGAPTIAEFWQNLSSGVESIAALTDQELLAGGADPVVLNDPSYVKAAAVLDNIEMFDASFFGFSPKDAAIMDPQHRFFLECAWEALENTGWSADEFPGPIGVFAGSGMNSYLIFNLVPNQALMHSAGLFLIKQTGNDKDVLATRVSYQLNLTGPSMTIQTACSTSLVAVHMACQSLLNHECDMALAGGVTIEIPHKMGYLYRAGEILSRDGHCRAFDAASSGTVFGSGSGVVVLRRLADAVADGDCIHAVIRGSAINNDGARKVGYLAPSVSGQADVVVEALAVAGVGAESISYVETHGTGTPVGDPIEIAALTQAFRQSTQARRFCAIGSLKTNIGHLDAAAGVAGLIKTTLALEHAQLPPSLHFSQPNPRIDFENSPFYVNSRLAEWTVSGGPRRAGVTSLGIGGTNAHVIVEQAPPRETSGASRPWQILTLSAKTATALESAERHLAGHLQDHPDLNLADVAYTCQRGRKAFPHRRAVLCQTAEQAIQSLRGAGPKQLLAGRAADAAGVAFLFPGQGSQYVNMTEGIYETEPAFRSQVDLCAELLRPQLGLDLRTLLFSSDEHQGGAGERLAQTWITQPALFVIEFALARLWMSWGIRPTAMIGHSVGEFVAACISGVLSLEHALSAVSARGRLMHSAPPGAMLAVGMPEQEAEALLSEGLALAAVNAPGQSVLSGPAQAIEKVEKALSGQGVPCHRLHTSHAFHSPSMDAILQPFTDVMRGFPLYPPKIPYLSNVTGTWIKAEEATDPSYWARHMRQTVRFSDGLHELLRQSPSFVLEVGPGRVLSALVARHPDKTENQKILCSTRSPQEPTGDLPFLLTTLAQLWSLGAKVDWAGFHAHERRHRVPLPTYPFERQRFWMEAPKAAGHPLPSLVERALPLEPSQAPAIEAKSAVSYYRPVWKKAELPATTREPGAGSTTWLIFLDSMGLGAKVAGLLGGTGGTVVTVSPGERFRKVREHAYSLRPGHLPDYESLLADLVHSEQVPQRIIHLWSLTPRDGSPPALETLAQTQDLCFYSLLFLAQAIGTQDLSEPMELGIVSNCLVQVDGEEVHHPERAVLLGPGRVLPKEFQSIRCRSIDIVLPGTNAGIGQQIIHEMSSASSASLVAYRAGERWVRTLEQTSVHPHSDDSRLRQQGVYLITGGLGGIGLAVAEYLAQTVQAKLVLVGRTGLPPRSHWEQWLETHTGDDPVRRKMRKIQTLETMGAEVLVAPGDVTDSAGMERVVLQTKERFGTIHGVFHAAGVLDDGLVQLKRREGADRVLSPKVKGTLVLDAALEGTPLDFFVLFSSVSSWLAPIGQVDYVAANAFLDAFASAKRSTAGNWTVAIDWGRWRSVGMAAQPAESRPGGRQGSRPAGEPSGHPLLGTSLVDTPEALVYNTDLNFDDHWILNEHRLHGGDALFPGTGYIELARAAMLERFGPGVIEFRRLSFNAPLKVGAGETRSLQIRLVKKDDGYMFSTVPDPPHSGGDRPSAVPCATGWVTYLGAAEPRSIDVQELLRNCSLRELTFGPESQNPKQARHIDFGPRWRCLKRICFGPNDAVSTLEIPAEFAADLNLFRSHPSLLDAATGSALLTIPDYDQTGDLYVPFSYKSCTLYADLPRRCYCHIRSQQTNTIRREVATFDLTLTDESGVVVAEIEDFVLRRLSSAKLLSGDHPPGDENAPRLLNGNEDFHLARLGESPRAPANAAIEPAQGVEALAAILRQEPLPQIIVVPSTLKFDQDENQSVSLPAESLERKPAATGSSNGAAAPRDEFERSLTEWWQELLGIQQVGIHDDFFELGGHSLIAVRLFAKIKKHFGPDLNLAALFEARTIETLANVVRSESFRSDGDATPWPSMVRIQKGSGMQPPLFFVHGLGGNVVSFNNLVRHLGPAESIYALQAQGLDGKQPLLTRVEDMAARYIREMQTVQPSGPYYLAGYSFGGFVAFEIAQQLQRQGHDVPFVALFDTRQMKHHKGLASSFFSIAMLGRYLGRIRDLLAEPGGRELILSRLRNKLFQLIFFKLPTGTVLRHIYKAGSSPLPRTLAMVEAANIDAAVNYKPGIYPGCLTLFRAEVRPMVDRFDLYLGWNGLATLGVDVHEVPGDHVTVGQEPNVGVMAEKFKLSLQKARDRQCQPVIGTVA